MLYHHSGTDYEVSASEAAKAARTKFEAEIERGKKNALAVIEQVNRDVPEDRVVRAGALKFSTEGMRVRIHLPDGAVQGFHRNGITQAATKADLTVGFIEKFMAKGEWGREMVAECLNKCYANGVSGRVLTRSVHNEVRGFLSDSYRRMDSRPILDSFVSAVQKIGGLPVDGYALETKIALKVVLPHVFEPVANEVMLFGAVFENSDFGNGAISVRTFVERLWCTNRAIANQDMRKVHLGARLGEDLQLSSRTYALDTRTMASAVGDIVGHSLGADNVNRYLAGIKKANEEKVDPSRVMEYMRKNLNKDEAEAAVDAFKSPDVEMMPAGNTAWRMSNAISWIANSFVKDPERKLDVMKVAGAVLEGSVTR